MTRLRRSLRLFALLAAGTLATTPLFAQETAVLQRHAQALDSLMDLAHAQFTDFRAVRGFATDLTLAEFTESVFFRSMTGEPIEPEARARAAALMRDHLNLLEAQMVLAAPLQEAASGLTLARTAAEPALVLPSAGGEAFTQWIALLAGVSAGVALAAPELDRRVSTGLLAGGLTLAAVNLFVKQASRRRLAEQAGQELGRVAVEARSQGTEAARRDYVRAELLAAARALASAEAAVQAAAEQPAGSLASVLSLAERYVTASLQAERLFEAHVTRAEALAGAYATDAALDAASRGRLATLQRTLAAALADWQAAQYDFARARHSLMGYLEVYDVN